MYVVISKALPQCKWITVNVPFDTEAEARKKAKLMRNLGFIAQVHELGPPLAE